MDQASPSSPSSDSLQEQEQQEQEQQQQQQQEQQQQPPEDKAVEEKPSAKPAASDNSSQSQGRPAGTEVDVDSLGPCMGLSIMHFLRNNPSVDLENSADMRRLGEAAVRGLLGLHPRDD